ncbi:phosphopantetheine-binding protein [Photorhabdus temperata]|uniref:Phosphopantetheine-containing protein n=1 Tax=Photorhabdus temperata subsp. temperata Meg1 TaxID=1393735 RepID=A0A081S1Z4_PHOTE|nr:phosphopantetheine-binding protein [Photorhabdus temperata]KER04947.1 phosphopantetheine-containing protein [Photorhabdus temperata subsp. temperata Meg1]MCT8346016.1 phosphopantetheine-binding protein [Photorhabdus temperata]
MLVDELSESNIRDDKVKALKDYITWLQDILEVSVTEDDNFLDLGGHSMIAISLNERINKQYGLSISMERLYNVSLIEAFSQAK